MHTVKTTNRRSHSRWSSITVVVGIMMSAMLPTGCHTSNSKLKQSTTTELKASDQVADRTQPEAVSLLGRPLPAVPMSNEVLASRERDLELAQFQYDRDPHDEAAIIWLGRRLAYLGRYNDAIDIFSNGLAIHPENYKLLRHRGHRYITVRKFDRALADLARAAELIEVGDAGGLADEIEPDGQPNAQNIPTSTSHTNIYYHLGLVRYLNGDFAGAADAYRQCMAFSKNDDMRVATAYWQYLTLKRLTHEDEAARVLESISTGMNIIENTSYLRLLLMFKGELTPEDAAKPSGEDVSVDLATTGYGIGMSYLLLGQPDQAEKQFRSVIENTNWAAFGHIAAEAELALLGNRSIKPDA